MNSYKAAVVFGGVGFIGSRLLRRLQKMDAERLYSVDIVPPRIKVKGVTYILCDIHDLQNFSLPDTVDVIFNLAGVYTTRGRPNHEYYETNIRGATEVTAFAPRNGIEQIMFPSSISVCGPSKETKSETTPPAPESAYSSIKWLAEGIHRSWLEEANERHLMICRPTVFFSYKEGDNFTRMSNLLRRGFFIYPGCKDTIKACFNAGDLGERSVLFNGAYPDCYTIEDIVQALKAQAFPKAHEMMVPKMVVASIATILRPFSILSLGVYPDRFLKLIRLIALVPGWIGQQGEAKDNDLRSPAYHGGLAERFNAAL